MISPSSESAIRAVVDARKAAGREIPRHERSMSIVLAVGDWNARPSPEKAAVIAMRALALCVEEGVDLDAAIAAVTARHGGRPLPDPRTRT